MDGSRKLCLRFGDDVTPTVRARVFYAFRVFCAIFGYRVTDEQTDPEAVCCEYGGTPRVMADGQVFHVPARYKMRDRGERGRFVAKKSYGGEPIPLFYGADEETGHPDWLGEIFEWISSSAEAGIMERDEVGRIPYSAMIFSLESVSPRKPYATILMSWLADAMGRRGTEKAPRRAPSPLTKVDHIVVSCHDIDFYHTHAGATLKRLVKNLAIARQLYESWSFFGTNVAMLGKRLGGAPVGNYLPALLAASGPYEFSSSIFVVSGGQHRRDPEYRLQALLPNLVAASKRGFSIDLHASYESAIERPGLIEEREAFERVVGKAPRGSRQHWLRFDDHAKLFDGVEKAGLVFDSSLGFAETVGFRNGASFAFPPYNFKKEAPYEFLEIPLVLMDGNLEAGARANGEPPHLLAEEALQASRKWGWGGIAAVWHNPIEAIQVPPEINEVFWSCLRNQNKYNEKWMSADQFLASCLDRYQQAGLLTSVRL